MATGIAIFVLILLLVGAGLMPLYRDSKRPLPKNLPPPLKDEDDEDDESR